MRTMFPICLAILAGCASAQPRAIFTRVPPTDASVIHADSAKRITARPSRVTSTACETNDPMAVRVPFPPPGSTRLTPTPKPGSVSAMPNAPTPRPLPYIPNACPVTAGPLVQTNVPAVLQGRAKENPTPEQP